jgi:hypothetical protein
LANFNINDNVDINMDAQIKEKNFELSDLQISENNFVSEKDNIFD